MALHQTFHKAYPDGADFSQNAPPHIGFAGQAIDLHTKCPLVCLKSLESIMPKIKKEMQTAVVCKCENLEYEGYVFQSVTLQKDNFTP